ncbi:NADPH-dependent F420 reductase [Pseudomonas typographi]|uniref:NAD(P)-binding domain-containing protein n=1 Tax=Pseudomonas typographi TaxID=2715964 RepID=A0ABR7Z1S7_9PSED|nr:NAD(P)-binding domain-containing protein [Pseudomonas typographi]MBD1551451.1 NAD(P)-binding domain-containing protein [Pseudomonas typographi]MBD1587563.1 NAD(P)-binding domain-containing protein [Pseudomonas typographi]MBD1599354.1 NAD(P)-binding domain-containing protein [Pseudomonas typographi]
MLKTLLLALAGLALCTTQALAEPLKIGVIGAGNVGGTLGTLWAQAGHPVMFASRHPDELAGLVKAAGANARAGSVADALAYADVIVLSVPYAAMPAISEQGRGTFQGKVVLSTSNPFSGRDGEVGRQALADGVASADQRYLPGARLVRAFNAIGYGSMKSQAHRQSGGPVAIATFADDAKAREVGARLVRDAGFIPVLLPLARANEGLPGGATSGVLSEAQLKSALGVAP